MVYKIKKGGSSKNWIQKAVNPKHKGYCTPMTKSTCTPHRKALAERFKKMAKHQQGGYIQKSVEQDKRNKDYLNNPFNLERLGKNIKNLVSMFKLPAIAGVSTVAAIPGLSMMGYGAATNIVAGATAGSSAILAPLMGNAFLSKSKPLKGNEQSYPKLHKKGGVIKYDISNILSQWKK